MTATIAIAIAKRTKTGFTVLRGTRRVPALHPARTCGRLAAYEAGIDVDIVDIVDIGGLAEPRAREGRGRVARARMCAVA